MEKNRVLLNLLKAGTYFVVGTAATVIVNVIRGGGTLQEAVITGCAVGAIAGIKNFVKHKFNINLDLLRFID